MVLYIIGLGLGTEQDITLRGLTAVQSSSHLFLESYTSILCVSSEKLEALYGKKVTIATRDMVESECELIVDPAKDEDVSFLVVGDPVCATTHTDIMIRAKDQGVEVILIHNASVMGAVGSSGLHLYTFGQTVSLCFFTETWRPTSFYPKLAYNFKGGMHTLCLLDIKVREPDFEAMAKGKTVFLSPRYMTVNQGLEQLIEAEDALKDGVIDADKTLVVGLARLGQSTQCIKAGTINELMNFDFGEPLHCLIVAAEDVSQAELDAVKEFIVGGSVWEGRVGK